MKLRKPLRRAGKRAASSLALSLLGAAAWPQDAHQAAPEPAAVDAKVAGRDVSVPPRKKYVAPEYPLDAAAQGIRGIVILEVLIGENGQVQSAKVTRSIPGLDEAAVNAVKLWEYEPTKVAGKFVKVLLSQSITFALKLPELQREPGVPELKSGGAPPLPSSLPTRQMASVAVTLGPLGEVAEASVLDGSPGLSEALLRAVRSWRFVVSEGATPTSFTVQAEWSPGPPPALTLKGLDPKPGSTAPLAVKTKAPPATTPMGTTDSTPVPAPPPSPAVDTDVLPARQEPQAKEQGASGVADVMLGENIPDLVKGRRPTWPPMARLGNVSGDVVVRFSVDLAGKVTVHSAEGPELLKASAEQGVATWLFRRTAIDRLHLVATFKFGGDRSVAKVERAVN